MPETAARDLAGQLRRVSRDRRAAGRPVRAATCSATSRSRSGGCRLRAPATSSRCGSPGTPAPAGCPGRGSTQPAPDSCSRSKRNGTPTASPGTAASCSAPTSPTARSAELAVYCTGDWDRALVAKHAAGRRAAAAVTARLRFGHDGRRRHPRPGGAGARAAGRAAGRRRRAHRERRGQPAPGPAFRRAPGAGARAAVRGVRASDGRAAPVQARGRARQGVGVRRLSRTVSCLRPRGHRSRL